VSVINY